MILPTHERSSSHHIAFDFLLDQNPAKRGPLLKFKWLRQEVSQGHRCLLSTQESSGYYHSKACLLCAARVYYQLPHESLFAELKYLLVHRRMLGPKG